MLDTFHRYTWFTMLGLAAVAPAESQAQLQCRPGMPCGPNLSASAHASAPAQLAHPSVVRIQNELPQASSYGSGTLIEKDSQYGWVLTCAHLFDDGVGRVSTYFPAAHHRYYADVIAVDRANDLALLLIKSPAAPATPLASQPPEPGETLTWHGFGQGSYRTASGPARRFVSLDAGKSWDALEWCGAARQGDSGGPAFNARGELVAVIAGSDGQISVGTACGRIRQFFSEYRQRVQLARPASPIEQPLVSVPQQESSREAEALREELAALRRELAQIKSNNSATPCPPAPTIEQLLEAMAADERFRGPAGKDGRDGTSASVEVEALTARLAALEAAFEGQIRYRLRRVPVAQTGE